MKKILRSIFLSPEIYVFFVSITLSFPFFNLYTELNDLIFPSTSTDIPYNTIVALFALTLTPSFFIAYKIIFPEESYKKYIEWDGYKTVVFICKYAVAYQLIGLIAFIILIALKKEFLDYYRYTISIYLSLLMALCTIVNAYISLKITLRKYEKT